MSEVKKAARARKKTAVATVDASPAKPAAGGGLEGAERNTRATFNWNPAIISPDQQIARDKDMAVIIADNGPGIPNEVLNRIFDPFFTTKEVGTGTGLGLSISYSIMEKLGGRILVASEVGKGTTFSLYIPIVHHEKA